MNKIGVMGPRQSVERILSVAKEMKTNFEFIPYPYESTSEIKELILDNNYKVNAWLFSGPVVYLVAKEALESDKNTFYITATESGLFKAMLDFIYEQNGTLNSFSIDLPKDMYPLDNTLKQLDNPPKNIYVKYMDSQTKSEELLEFHMNLWKQGKTEGGISCLPSITEELKRVGVPASWLTTSRLETRKAIEIVVENLRSSYFKGAQIGVEMIQVENFDKVINKVKSTYYLQRLELRLKDIIIGLCEKIDGSLSERGNGRYVIISTRGAIEDEISTLKNTILQLSVEADSNVDVGIGYGETVLSAEVNAYNAMQQSKEKSGSDIVIIQENGLIIEYDEKEEELAYFPRTSDSELIDKLKSGNISVKTYKKIYALNQKMGWCQFTTRDIANNLQMTERNSRRIVSELCKIGLVLCVGEEDFSTRGRPSKLYKLI
ncbi:hypothetical protein [Clostridium beijerinckii]|uniref:Transcriptional regulator n=1 Tax=Clostridium beijerinckii TaxID=1520 RepID=A0AAW3W558_CLOBE|nr:hypothetical protein [Clostridium beijerinckii]MBC2456726.1 hypothetical protein [Clostridium beijerinckii]MBC2474026.1 hypothetical protein [Clostridium beijerinckii]MDG5853556.1 hypothetical protein [Clostridium beijerinckii]NOV61382.1 hypothetical protein [Clostridium beijerinckii]NOV69124.1 hypothetical protein [Clostridium beijerinckii]